MSATANVQQLLKQAYLTIEKLKAGPARAEPLAVVGMACYFPGGIRTPQAFWQSLLDKQDLAGDAPVSRWSGAQAPDAQAYPRGYFLDAIDRFDAGFFSITPREANWMDPAQRLLMECGWLALEDAGIDPATLYGARAGIWLAMGQSEYLHDCAADELDAYSITGSAHCMMPGRLAHFLGTTGPSMVVDTGCSSALSALKLAGDSLRGGEADLALVGGVSLYLSAAGSVVFSRANMLSPDGRCKTFSADADGYARGEGCGMVVVKRLSDALAAGDRIYAQILGGAINQNGTGGGLTVPNGVAQEAVIRQALRHAGVDAQSVSYVETHGTGTPLGDPIEAGALARVYGAGRETPLRVGAVKTHVGHLESAAGIAGLIKLLLAFQHQRLPGNLHFSSPNPHIDWQEQPLDIVTDACDWPAGETPRCAGLSAFGLGGSNAHIILQEAPAAEPAPAADAGRVLLPLSAKTPAALRELAQNYREWLGQTACAPADIARSAATGRHHFTYRLLAQGESRQALAGQLDDFLQGPEPAGALPVKTAWLFSGQGSQYAGMLAALYSRQPAFREAFDRCAALIGDRLDVTPAALMWGDAQDKLAQTRYTQPVLFTAEYALGCMWLRLGLRPDALLGHSVGEYAAACLAGVFSLEDALRLVIARGALIDRCCAPGAMLALMAPAQDITPLLAGTHAGIAAYNGRAKHTVAGTREEMALVAGRAQAAGIAAIPLRVSHGFHCALMQPALAPFRAEAETVVFRPPQYRYVSGLLGREAGAEVACADYWVRHIEQSVRFSQGLSALAQMPCTAFLEIGPGRVLTDLGRQEDERACDWLPGFTAAAEDAATWADTLAYFYRRGAQLDWAQVCPEGRRVTLPGYPFQRSRYWRSARTAPTPRAAAVRHGLSGVRSANSGEWLFSAGGRDGLPCDFNDHQVLGSAVAPAAMWLAMALNGGAQVNGHGALTLRHVVLTQPLMVQDPLTLRLQCAFTPQAQGGTWDVAGFSQSGEDAAWRSHVSATMAPAPAAPGDTWSAPQEAGEPGDIWYRRAAERGYVYGPSFRLIERWLRADGGIVSRLGGGENGFTPALLDACLQTGVIGLNDGDEERRYLPFSAEEIRVYRPPSGPMWCRARLRDEAAGDGALLFDIALYDDRGECLLEIDAMQMRLLRESAGERAAYQFTRWQWQPLPVADDSGAGGERWLLLADDGGEWRTLAETLRRQGGDVTVAGNDATDLRQRENIAALIRRTEGLTGVISCLALTESPDDAAPERAAGHTLALAQAFLECFPAQPRPLLCQLTRGAQAVLPADIPGSAAGAVAWGMMKALEQEVPDLNFRCLDLTTLAAADCAQLLSCLRAEGPNALALRDGVCLTRRYAPVAADGDTLIPAQLPADKTFIISGGTRGIGLLLAQWLVEKGARHLLLLGRHAPAADAAQAIAALGARAQVVTACADVADMPSLTTALAAVTRPVGGVFHLAALTDDGLLENQTPATMARVIAPKLRGAQNLRQALTASPPDFFVIFSSAASVLGAVGQSNYVIANTLVDALAQRWRREGFPAAAINWGPWRDTGMAAGLSFSLPSLAPAACLDALARLPAALPLVAVLPAGLQANAPPALPQDDAFLRELQELPAAQRAEHIARRISAHIAASLGVGAETIGRETTLSEYGLDSIMAVEIRNALCRETGLTLSPTLLFNYPTVNALSRMVGQALFGAEAPAQEEKADDYQHYSDNELLALYSREFGLNGLSGEEKDGR